MQNDEEAARPYARALAQAAQDLGLMARVRADMEALEAQWEGSEPLRRWARGFHSMPRAQHRATVDALWGDTMAPPTRKLLEALSVHGLLAAIPAVIKAFRRFADKAEGRLDVDIVFAAPPKPETEAALRARAVEAYGPNTRVTVATDARLGAGLVVRAGHTQFDGSLKGRLRRLRHAFAQ